MTSSLLNLDQQPTELNAIYTDNYYWYLTSTPFKQHCLSVIGNIVNGLGFKCLDVACGEGWLSPFICTPYVGFDGSEVAIAKAKEAYPDREFYVDRLEDPKVTGTFGTIVFGNIFAIIVKKTHWLEFIEMYITSFMPSYFVLYDLEELNTAVLDAAYTKCQEHSIVLELEKIEEVKKHRKIILYKID